MTRKQRMFRPFDSQRFKNKTGWSVCLAAIRCDTHSLDATVTDLHGWYTCRMEAGALRELMREQELDPGDESSNVELDRLLSMVQECFDDGSCLSENHFVIEQAGDHAASTGGVLLRFNMPADRIALRFPCAAHPDPSTRLQDELVLPLLRTVEQLRELLPAGAAWVPPGGGALPLPDYDQWRRCDPLARIMRRASVAQASAAAEGATGAASAAGASDATSSVQPRGETAGETSDALKRAQADREAAAAEAERARKVAKKKAKLEAKEDRRGL